MSDDNVLVPAESSTVQEPYHAAALVVPPRPDEVCFSLTEDEFQTLCDGETSKVRGSRDLCIGACLTALLGLLGIVATVEWGAVWERHRLLPFEVCAVMLVIAAASAFGWLTNQKTLTHIRESSSYSRLKARIEGFFETTGKSST